MVYFSDDGLVHLIFGIKDRIFYILLYFACLLSIWVVLVTHQILNILKNLVVKMSIDMAVTMLLWFSYVLFLHFFFFFLLHLLCVCAFVSPADHAIASTTCDDGTALLITMNFIDLICILVWFFEIFLLLSMYGYTILESISVCNIPRLSPFATYYYEIYEPRHTHTHMNTIVFSTMLWNSKNAHIGINSKNLKNMSNQRLHLVRHMISIATEPMQNICV